MTNTIFKKKDTYNEFRKILRDKEYSLNFHWFKRVMFETLITSTWKVQYKTSLKLLKVYNDYFKTNFSIDDLFIWDKILNKKTTNRNVEFMLIDDWWESLSKFIDEVLKF